MPSDLPKKLRKQRDFVKHVAEISHLFERADLESLRAAVKTGTSQAVYEALGVDSRVLESILKHGINTVKGAVHADPDLAAEAEKRRPQEAR
jgi:hypothetical protein